MARRPSRREDFEIVIVCTLPLEFDAVALTFDEIWDEKAFGKAPGDDNTYALGRIGNHDVVVFLLLSMGKIGQVTATVALHRSFTKISFFVLTGICGGLPRAGTNSEILLGDVLISKSAVLLDTGRSLILADDVRWTPDRKIRSVLATFETHHGRRNLRKQAGQILHQVQVAARQRDQTLSRPPSEEDHLFESEYLHRHRDPHDCSCSTNDACIEAASASCDELHCEPARLVPRKRLLKEDQKDGLAETSGFQVFCGRVGLSDTVFKSGSVRDKAAEEHDLIAFDTTRVGILNELPCILVKGVCDYADGHRNKTWQRYAAATAASTTAAMLDPLGEPHRARPIFIVPSSQKKNFVSRPGIFDEVKRLLGHQEGQQQASKPRAQVALYGPGGVGKTEIALEYVYWLRSAYPDVSVFWVVASDAAEYRKSYLSVAEKLEIGGRNDPTIDIIGLVNCWLETEYRERWLMVIDDAHDKRLSIPEHPNGSILMTTRSRSTGSWFVPGRQLIEVPSMSESELYKPRRAILRLGALDLEAETNKLPMPQPSRLEIAQKYDGMYKLVNAHYEQPDHLMGYSKDDSPITFSTLRAKHLQSTERKAPGPLATETRPFDTENENSFVADCQNFSGKLPVSLGNDENWIEKLHTRRPKESFGKHNIDIGAWEPDSCGPSRTISQASFNEPDELESVTFNQASFGDGMLNHFHRHQADGSHFGDDADEMESLASSSDSSVPCSQFCNENPAAPKLSLFNNDVNRVGVADMKKTKAKDFYQQPDGIDPLDDEDEIPSSISDSVSDSESSAIASQVFSENPASTKLSSLENDVNRAEEANPTKPKAESFYNHQTNKFDDNDEIQSIISDFEDIQSQDGSGSVRWEVRDAAVSYIAEMLANDPFLEPLYKNAARRLEGKRFVRNHCRLLKSYYLSLRSQASNQKQGVAIAFLRPRAHRTLISIKIRENMEVQDTRREKIHAELPQDEGRDLTLERYLSGVGASSKNHADDTVEAIRGANEGRNDDWMTEEQNGDDVNEDEEREEAESEDEESEGEDSQDEEGGEEQSEDDWKGKEEEYDAGAGLISLGETKSFFVSGKPFVDFKISFRDFLYPNSGAEEETGPKKTKPKLSNVVSRGAMLRARLFDMWSPPKDGCQRVRYICDCGDYTFMDVRELSPGGLERFRQRLACHGPSNIIAASAPTEFPDGLSPPPSAYLGTARSRSVTSQSSGRSSSRRSSLSTQPTSMSGSEDEAPPQDEQTIPQYLLLCVNQKSLPELIHIDCRPFQNDQYLCQQILKEYQITRDKSTWRPSLLLHAKLLAVLSGVSSFLEKKTPRWLQWTFRLSRSIFEISFFQMDTGDFVRFQLVPVGELTVPNHFKCAEFPPESEVKAGNYEYEPVPMIDVAIASIPLWHLTRPVQHSDMYWIKTFPKKMRSPLYRQSGVYGKPVVGWGIRVNESFHWKHFLFLILAVSIGISIIVAIYVAVTSDASSAFGLGAFLAALVAIYIPHQYFAWKERLS